MHPMHETHAWLSGDTADPSQSGRPGLIVARLFLWLTMKDPENAGVQLSW